MSESRTHKSIRNAQVTLFFSVITILISFFSRKYFLASFDSEVMGLRTVLGNFLGMLNLSELGIGTSIAVALYKPLNDRNYQSVNEIVSLQGWLYRWVVGFIVFGSVVLMLFFPQMFANMQASLWYAYVTYGFLLFSTILSYTINYKTIVLSADQKGYKTGAIMSTATIAKNFIQLLILYFLEDAYLLWISMDLALSILGVYVLDRVTVREYPWLSVNPSKGRQYLKKYPALLKQTGLIFFHNLGGYALGNTTPLVMSLVSGLVMTGDYDNYKNLITHVRTFSEGIFGNLIPGVGNLIAEGNQEKIYSFFWEVLSFKYFIAGISCFFLYVFATPFVSLWLGEKYALESSLGILLLTLIAYIDFTRGVNNAYINGFALFKDIWAPLVEAGINVGMSILLGYILGWEGVLLGVFISLFTIIVVWKPFYLFRSGFQLPVRLYWLGMTKFPLITWGLIFLTDAFVDLYQPSMESYTEFFINASWVSILFIVILFGVFYVVSKAFRAASMRAWQIVAERIPLIKKRY